MLYLSELLGKHVINQNGQTIGTLADLAFVLGDVPNITKLQVKTDKNSYTVFPLSTLKRINGQIQLNGSEVSQIADNELLIRNTLLNRQIIDIKGRNIVRVNDVVIQDKPTMVISGIDIGLLGIARWFGIEDQFTYLTRVLKLKVSNKLLPWSDIQPLELTSGRVVLNQDKNKLQAIPPEDLADYLEKTTVQNSLQILSLISDETASEVVKNLNINYQAQLFKQMKVTDAVSIITYADPDEAVDLLLTVSEKKREEILMRLPEEIQKKLSFLLKHSDTAIGELMTTEYITFQPEDTVRHAIDRIRKETNGFDTLSYGYVINNKNELSGVFSLHELLMQQENTQLLKFMIPNLIVLHLTTPRKTALKRLLKFKLQSIPVIDEHRNILGVVTIDDLIEPILEKLD